LVKGTIMKIYELPNGDWTLNKPDDIKAIEDWLKKGNESNKTIVRVIENGRIVAWSVLILVVVAMAVVLYATR